MNEDSEECVDKTLQQEVNQVAEVHFFLKPMMKRALINNWITAEGKQLVGDYDSYYDYWQATFGEKFFDMTTMVRLGTAIENCLRRYYMQQRGHMTATELRNDPLYSKCRRGVFQRIQSWQLKDGAIVLYKEALGYDLTKNPHLTSVQETMAHRNLYAHNSGLLDDEYIKNIQKITQENIMQRVALSSTTYPDEDVYWFAPLDNLGTLIEETRRFFRQFP